MSEKSSKPYIYIIVGLMVSTLALATFSGINLVNLNNVKQDRDTLQEEYNRAYQDYLDVLNDLDATEKDLANALTNLQIAEQNLQEAEAELQLIEDNTDLSGTFYILSQYNKDYDLSATTIKSERSYSDYFFYRLSLEHPEHDTVSSYLELAQVIAGYCRPSSVQSLAEFIRDNVDAPLNNECVIDGLLTYCQDRGDFEHCIHYVEDGVDDFSKYPMETLCEGCGDCEDKSILFASLARSIGFDVRICIIPGHALVAVKLDSAPTHGDAWHITLPDGNYYTCETTGYGWLIGDLPPDYQGGTVYSYQVL